MGGYRGREQTIALFREYRLFDETFKNLDIFLSAKEQYFADKTLDNRVAMKLAYEDVFIDIKSALVAHQISRLDFFNLDDLLKEGFSYE